MFDTVCINKKNVVELFCRKLLRFKNMEYEKCNLLDGVFESLCATQYGVWGGMFRTEGDDIGQANRLAQELARGTNTSKR